MLNGQVGATVLNVLILRKIIPFGFSLILLGMQLLVFWGRDFGN